MIDFQQLRQLVTIAELGSLSAAAEKLHISQPALSRSMQRLEEYLGLRLFERTRNRIIFRDLGLRAVELANNLLRDANRYVDDLRTYALRQSTIIIGANVPAPMWRLSAEIHERFPELVVTEEIVPHETLAEGLRGGHFRLVLTHKPLREPGLLCREYLEERLVLEMPPSHPLGRKEALTAEDLRNLDVLAYRNLGVWRERIRDVAELHLIELTELDVLEDLALSSGLPLLRSSLSPSRSSASSGRVSLPILGEAAVLSLYLCARKDDQALFSRLC